jgi:hypothetical protein
MNYLEKELEGGITLIVSLEIEGLEEELGLDYGTLEECLEIKEIGGVKLYFVYI